MNRKNVRLLALVALVMTAGLAACKNNKNEAKMNETAPMATQGNNWGSGPYSQWEPVTPPSKMGK